ncbi:MAG: RelA/SpoT family protein [Methylococcales bacterium]|nr:RelA/SpoT family protein [Methylococcales bacterium]
MTLPTHHALLEDWHHRAGTEQHQQLKQALAALADCPAPPSGAVTGDQAAAVLLNLRIDCDSLLAALLSDARLIELLPIASLTTTYNPIVARLVKDARWLNATTLFQPEAHASADQSERIRRMLLATTHDVRAVLIHLAYRIITLRQLTILPLAMRQAIAQETLAVHAPLASRLGISQFKWELEDLAFRALQPDTYRDIARGLMENRARREARVERFLVKLRTLLKAHDITAEVSGRPKHIYSIFNKMRRKSLTLAELYDLLAVRVTVHNVSECYLVLGLVHNQWSAIPKEFDDYIANPKENGYQSLHTVVISDTGERLEIQIRTQAMHEFAELGVAAHWRYKEGGRHHAASEKAIASLRRLLAHDASTGELAQAFQTELFSDRVYALTPQGQIIDLIKGATALDFAYAIHTDIGHACRGAKINGLLKPLTTPLRTGDCVAILTHKQSKPNRNWLDTNLGYLKTPKALNKVRAWFRNHDKTRHLMAGKQLLDKAVKRLKLTTWSWPTLLSKLDYADRESVWTALGSGQLSIAQVLAALPQRPAADTVRTSTKTPQTQHAQVRVAGIDGVKIVLAQCCQPAPPAAVSAYVTARKGIVIHRQDCPNLEALPPAQQQRLLPACWQPWQAVRETSRRLNCTT